MTSTMQNNQHIVTIDGCLREAQILARRTSDHYSHHRIKNAFTALANGDSAVGLLAYYL